MGDPRIAKPTPAEIIALGGSYLTLPIYTNTIVDYLFNEGDGLGGTTITDISGNSLDLTYANAVAGDWQDNGLLFNGVAHSAVTAASSLLAITGNLSFELWFTLNTWVNSNSFVNLGGGSGETEDSNLLLFLRVGSVDSPNIDINYLHEYGAGNNQTNDFNTNLSTSTLYHLAIVRDVTANTVKVYINGIFHSTYNYTNDPTIIGDATLSINLGQALVMLFYRLRIASRVWSDAEVLQLFNDPWAAFTANSLTFTGTQAQINADLATLVYTPDSGYVGADTLNVESEDAAGNITISDIPIDVHI